MKSILYIGGITNSGKSHLLMSVKDSLKEARTSISFVDFSSLLRTKFKELSGQNDFRRLKQDRLLLLAADNATAALLDTQPVLVTGHYFYQTPEGRQVYEKPFFQISPCIAFLHLVCEPSTLIERLSERGLSVPIDKLIDDLEFSLNQAKSISQRCHTPLHLLQNDKSPDLAANVTFVNSLLKQAGLLEK
ncbi:AAA family ATPase [Patescibacteria group bacterium]|nr:AAA family ATPase [Patescibacteria group bacterium]